MTQWEKNAHEAEEVYGSFVDWDERFYICPECSEPVYESDWGEMLNYYICPICLFPDNED